MDEGSRGMLDSYKSGIDNYVQRLGNDHPKIRELMACFSEFEQLGESCADFGAFHAAATEKNFYARLTNLMTEAAMAQPAAGGKANEPTVAQAAQGYHAAYDSMSPEIQAGPTGKLYQRIFQLEKECDSPLQFMRRLAEEHLLVDISRIQLIAEFARAQRLLKEAPQQTGGAGVSLPATDAYLQATQKSMNEAGSITEVEYLMVARAEIAQLATLWDTGFCTAIYHRFGSELSGYMLNSSEEQRQRVENCYRFVADYFGVDWDGLHKIERVWDFFTVTLWAAVKGDYAQKGIHSAEQFKDYLKTYLDRAMKDKSPVNVNAQNRSVDFWGKKVALGEVHQQLLNPPDLLA